MLRPRRLSSRSAIASSAFCHLDRSAAGDRTTTAHRALARASAIFLPKLSPTTISAFRQPWTNTILLQVIRQTSRQVCICAGVTNEHSRVHQVYRSLRFPSQARIPRTRYKSPWANPDFRFLPGIGARHSARDQGSKKSGDSQYQLAEEVEHPCPTCPLYRVGHQPASPNRTNEPGHFPARTSIVSGSPTLAEDVRQMSRVNILDVIGEDA